MPKMKKKLKKINRISIVSESKSLQNHFTSLIIANDQNELEKVLSIKKNNDLLKKNNYFDPFVIAIKANHLHLIKFFNDSNFNLINDKDDQKNEEENKNDHSYCRSLIEAIKCSNEAAIDILIELNISMNSSNYKFVPIQVAYNIYSLEKENSLLISSYDTTKLKKSENILKKLIHNNADPNVYNNHGYRFIHQIILDKDLQILELIIKNCTNLKMNTLTYGKMQNSLHLISESKKRSKSSQNDEETSNTSLNSISESKMPLNWFSCKKLMNGLHLKLAKVLIDSGCNMDHTDYHLRETPAFKAIVNNYYDLIKFFVIEGMDMSIRNRSGNDALSRSIQLGRYKIARLLIAADSPIRVYSCFYKIPNIDEFKSSNHNYQNSSSYHENGEEEDVYDEEMINSENFLQYSIANYEKFLIFLQKYTREPRSLVDLSRLVVRNCIKKPISKWLPEIRVPRQIEDVILLKNIENMIRIK